MIAIDEPETAMLRIVAEYAREAATRSQNILTTHSAEILNAFGREPPTTKRFAKGLRHLTFGLDMR